MLDTGADSSAVYARFASEQHLPRGQTAKISGATGDADETTTPLDSLLVDGWSIQHVTADTIPDRSDGARIDGIVGADILMNRRWARGAYTGTVLAAGLFLAPFVLPVLPIEGFIAYQHAFGDFRPVVIERTAPGPLPLQFAAEFGWEQMAEETAKIFHSLPAGDQKNTAIFANDYSEAGAIDFFGPRYGLPPAVSKDVTYFLWGPRDYTGKTVIVLGSDGVGDRQHFREVIAAGRAQTKFSRTDEQFDIFLCRDLNADLRSLWPSLKHWGA